jgi:hypothetical protein
MAIRTVAPVRRWARHGSGLVARLATAWVCRAALDPESYGDRHQRDVETLVDAMSERDDPHAAAMIELLWAVSEEHRTWIWRRIWRSVEYVRAPDEIRLSLPTWEFLLGPDPDCQYQPQIRLVRAVDGHIDVLPWLLSAADPPRGPVPETDAVRLAVVRALRGTDEPSLLGGLESAFLAALRAELTYGTSDWARFPSDPTSQLWYGSTFTPRPLAAIVLANPRIPRRDPAGTMDLALLHALRGQFHMLGRFNASNLVPYLLRIAGRTPGHPLTETARKALRSLPPGPGHEKITRLVLAGDRAAAEVATGADHWPVDPDAEPLFLLLTRQWDRFRVVDPDGERLGSYRVRPEGPDRRVELVDRILGVLTASGVPRAVRTTCLAALARIGPGPARDRLCQRAETDGNARAAVIAAGHLPSDDRRVPAFLFLTGQWDRYDAVDPDGSVLRTYAEALKPDDPERNRLRIAARHAKRKRPCGPARRQPAAAPERRRTSIGSRQSTGHPGVSGSGRYSDGGHGSGGHGHGGHF